MVHEHFKVNYIIKRKV